MATIAFEHLHRTEPQDAAQRARSLIETLRAENPRLIKTVTWSNDGMTGHAKGKGFKGDFRVTDTHVIVAINLSWIVSPLKGRVSDSLRKRMIDEFGA